MSNHFTGLRLGPPAEDPRLDLTDLFAFQAPADPTRTVLILNANTFGVADAFHPDAVYRINVDNDGDAETDVAFSVVFDKPEDGRQRATVYMATGPDARRSEAVGSPIVTNAEVSFGPEPKIVTAGARTFFAGSRSDPFFVDFAGILAAFNWKDGKNFTDLKDVDPFPWTGNDTLAVYNAFGIVLELPTSELGPDPSLGIWGRASVHSNGTFDHVDRAGHPTIASFFNTDETKEQYNRTEPARDRELFLHQAIEILEHNGGYSAQQAEAVIDEAPRDDLQQQRAERRAQASRRPARGLSLPRHTAPESPTATTATGVARSTPHNASGDPAAHRDPRRRRSAPPRSRGSLPVANR